MRPLLALGSGIAVFSIASAAPAKELPATPQVMDGTCSTPGDPTSPLSSLAGAVTGASTLSQSATGGASIEAGPVTVDFEVTGHHCGLTDSYIDVEGDLSGSGAGKGAEPGTGGAQGAAPKAGEGKSGTGVDVKVKSGAKLRLQMTLPDAYSKDVQSGRVPPPNPFDPASLPDGSSVILTAGAFDSVEMEGEYRGIFAAAKVDESLGYVVGIIKLPDGKVQVIVGPQQLVETEVKLGLGNSQLNGGVQFGDEWSQGTLKSWTFDPSNPAQAAGLQSLMHGGDPGVQPDTIQYTHDESSLGLYGQAGPLGFHVDLAGATKDVRKVTHPDGSGEIDVSYDNSNGEAISQTIPCDATGHCDLDATKTSVTVPGGALDANDGYPRKMLGLAFGHELPSGGPVAFSMCNAGDSAKWRDAAKAFLAQAAKNGPIMPDMAFVQELAQAKSDSEVSQILLNWLSSNSGKAAETIYRMSNFGKSPLPICTTSASCP